MPSIAECLPTFRYFYTPFRTDIWIGDGFRDAFNLRTNWWDSDVFGLDQGPILIMVENCSQKVWQVLKPRGATRTGSGRFHPSHWLMRRAIHSKLASHKRAFLSG